MTKGCRMILWSGLFLYLFISSAAQAMTGLTLLADPSFYNGWSQDDPVWADMLHAYTDGQFDIAVQHLTERFTQSQHTPSANSSATSSVASSTTSPITPNALLAVMNLASLYKDMNLLPEAIAAYRQAVAIAPQQSKLWRDLGWALYNVAKWDEAVDAFRKSWQLESADPWTLYGWGMALTAAALAPAPAPAPAAPAPASAPAPAAPASASAPAPAPANSEQGLQFLEQAVELDPLLGAAQYDLGLIYLKLGRQDEALQALQAALKADGNFTAVHAYLAGIYEQKGQLSEAWSAYKKGVLARPQDNELAQAKAHFQTEHADFIKNLEQGASADRASVKPMTVTPINVAGAPLVRVGLVEGAVELRISWGAPLQVERNNRKVATLPAGGIWTLTRDGNILTLASFDRKLSITAAAPWTLRNGSDAATITVYDMEVAKGSFYAYVEHRHYRGDMEVQLRSAGITLINVLDLESYLASVLPSEMYSTMPAEALKVQAVAARTYTLRSMGKYAARGFDVLGSPMSSEYRGAQVEQASTTQAVLATVGKVLETADGVLAEAYYSATSGGYSVSPEEVWGGASSNLPVTLDAAPGLATPASAALPVFPLGPAALEAWVKQAPTVFASISRFAQRSSFRWVKFIDPAELAQKVNAEQEIGSVLAIIAGKRGVGGHVLELTIKGTAGSYLVKGDSAIRSICGGLRSSLFKVEAQYGADGRPVRFVIFGGGYGHGVGLDQLGASGMAEMGYTMVEILNHYYGTMRLTQRY